MTRIKMCYILNTKKKWEAQSPTVSSSWSSKISTLLLSRLSVWHLECFAHQHFTWARPGCGEETWVPYVNRRSCVCVAWNGKSCPSVAPVLKSVNVYCRIRPLTLSVLSLYLLELGSYSWIPRTDSIMKTAHQVLLYVFSFNKLCNCHIWRVDPSF